MYEVLFFVTRFFFVSFILRNVLFWTHIFQVKGYRWDRVWVFLKETKQGRSILFGSSNLLKIILFFFYFVTIFSSSLYPVFLALIGFTYAVSFVQILREIRQRDLRVPLFTARVFFIFTLSLSFLYILFAFPLLDKFFWFLFVDKLTPFVIYFFLFASSIPAEFYKDTLINRASELIRQKRELLTIGIAGSYGKGSVKEYSAQILSDKFNVLKTIGTYNTPVGAAKTILANFHTRKQIFIAEMGAYRRGEVKEICEMIRPTLGVITRLDDSLLSLFKNEENIKKSARELLESLPKNGLSIFNGNSPVTLALYKEWKKKKILTLADYADTAEPNADVRAYDIRAQKFEVNFRVKIKDVYLGKFSAHILGRQAVETILPGIFLAYQANMIFAEIRKAVKSLRPIPRSCSPYKTNRGAVLVDDTFTSALASIRQLCDYAALYKGKKIMVLTPIAELGKNAKSAHIETGKLIGETFDTLFLLNENYYREISKGIHEGGGGCKIYTWNAEKIAEFVKNLSNRDVAIFEGREAGGVLPYVSYEEI